MFEPLADLGHQDLPGVLLRAQRHWVSAILDPTSIDVPEPLLAQSEPDGQDRLRHPAPTPQNRDALIDRDEALSHLGLRLRPPLAVELVQELNTRGPGHVLLALPVELPNVRLHLVRLEGVVVLVQLVENAST